MAQWQTNPLNVYKSQNQRNVDLNQYTAACKKASARILCDAGAPFIFSINHRTRSNATQSTKL